MRIQLKPWITVWHIPFDLLWDFPGKKVNIVFPPFSQKILQKKYFGGFAICFTRGSGEIIPNLWLIWSDDMWNPHCIHQLAFKWCFLQTFTFTCECTAPQTSTSQPPDSDNHFTTFRSSCSSDWNPNFLNLPKMTTMKKTRSLKGVKYDYFQSTL